MKKTYYFSHDFNARQDPKLQKLQMIMGQEGKGIYWDLIEMLYEQEGYLMLSEYESYAFAMRTDKDKVQRVISEFDLFEQKDATFFSNSVLLRLGIMKEKSEKASKSAQFRWNNANAMRTQSEGNAIKEKKIKEKKIKEKKEKRFVPPSLEELKSYFAEHGVTSKEYENWYNFYESKDWMIGKNKMKSWKAAVRTWVGRMDIQPEPLKPPKTPKELEFEEFMERTRNKDAGMAR